MIVCIEVIRFHHVGISSLHCLYRNMEDFVTWTDTSKIKRHVLEYNEEVCIIVLSVDKVLMRTCADIHLPPVWPMGRLAELGH